MNIKPLADRVLVVPAPAEDFSIGILSKKIIGNFIHFFNSAHISVE